jgi:hypothetical protein
VLAIGFSGIANALAAGSAPHLTELLLKRGDEASTAPFGAVQVAKGVREWASVLDTSSSGVGDRKRWRSEGLVAGAFEYTLTTNGTGHQGVSWVEEFKSAASAKREIAHIFKVGTNPPLEEYQLVDFRVPGVPGAKGFAITAVGQHSGPSPADVVWTEGTCALSINSEIDATTRSRRAMATAAGNIYKRTGGHCPD